MAVNETEHVKEKVLEISITEFGTYLKKRLNAIC
jgi:hypothetical protein